MQLVGPTRYGIYTFFLTLLALELSSVGQPASWRLVLSRVLLTFAGAGVAVGPGAGGIVLTNQNGAVLTLSGRQMGLIVAADLNGLVISLR